MTHATLLLISLNVLFVSTRVFDFPFIFRFFALRYCFSTIPDTLGFLGVSGIDPTDALTRPNLAIMIQHWSGICIIVPALFLCFLFFLCGLSWLQPTSASCVAKGVGLWSENSAFSGALILMRLCVSDFISRQRTICFSRCA